MDEVSDLSDLARVDATTTALLNMLPCVHDLELFDSSLVLRHLLDVSQRVTRMRLHTLKVHQETWGVGEWQMVSRIPTLTELRLYGIDSDAEQHSDKEMKRRNDAEQHNDGDEQENKRSDAERHNDEEEKDNKHNGAEQRSDDDEEEEEEEKDNNNRKGALAVSVIPHVRSLTLISCSENQVPPFLHRALPHLRSLSLHGGIAQVPSGAGLEWARSLTSLTLIGCSFCSATEIATVTEATKAGATPTVVQRATAMTAVGSGQALRFISSLRALTSLDMDLCPDAAAFPQWSSLTRLTRLRYRCRALSLSPYVPHVSNDLARLVVTLPWLTEVNISGWSRLDGHFLASLARLPKLRTLDLSCTTWPTSNILPVSIVLKSMTQLQRLVIRELRISFSLVSCMVWLQWLTISRKRLTRTAAEAATLDPLSRAGCVVEWHEVGYNTDMDWGAL